MINRKIESILRTMAAQFMVVAITGPRQSGKLIYGGDQDWTEDGVEILTWRQVAELGF
jgi:hypothetical protein